MGKWKHLQRAEDRPAHEIICKFNILEYHDVELIDQESFKNLYGHLSLAWTDFFKAILEC